MTQVTIKTGHIDIIPFLILDHFNNSTLLFIYTLFFYVYLICKYMPAFFVCLFVLRQPHPHCVSYVCVCRDDDVLYVSEGDSFEGECDDLQPRGQRCAAGVFLTLSSECAEVPAHALNLYCFGFFSFLFYSDIQMMSLI